ncbi:hypothetical protein llap_21742 [Limosa lapponica baueri]|uniref:Uncharacterized protein n=1 Tax=Limosa lapponica baueri TaxID=1758121 RepID=A0A2I0T2E4_LIMLA|nr:hypothetical protein llap_21742 [Limosa lapponica baueri]
MASGCAAAEEEDAATEPSGGPREPCSVAVGCSWPCAPPDGLSRALCLRGDAGCGEASTEAVVVERRAGGGGQAPCVLELECRPAGAGEMVSVSVLSEARNMEVYVGEEYCGTGRGENLGAARAPGLPLGDKLNWIFGKNSDLGDDRAIDGSCGAAIQTSLDQSASEPLSVKNNLKSETIYDDLKISRDLNTQVPERGDTFDSERLTTQQNTVDLRNYFKVMGSLHAQEQVSETPNVANPQVLLPFLQNLCSQVNHLRLRDGDRHFGKNAAAKEESLQSVG